MNGRILVFKCPFIVSLHIDRPKFYNIHDFHKLNFLPIFPENITETHFYRPIAVSYGKSSTNSNSNERKKEEKQRKEKASDKQIVLLFARGRHSTVVLDWMK